MEEIKIDCVYNYKGSTHSYLTVRIMDVNNFEIYSSHGELIEKLHDVADCFYILYLVSIGEYPRNTGTFVIVQVGNTKRLGTVVCYQCVTEEDEEDMVMVSGYKESWCGEYLLSEVKIATDEEIRHI